MKDHGRMAVSCVMLFMTETTSQDREEYLELAHVCLIFKLIFFFIHSFLFPFKHKHKQSWNININNHKTIINNQT